MTKQYKSWTCEICDYTGTITNKFNHLKTKKHKNNEIKELKNIVIMKDQISEQSNKTKKVYKPKMWTCEACNYTCTIKNKTNHERTDKHNNIEIKKLKNIIIMRKKEQDV